MDATDELCVNAIRCLAVDAVERARSGNPGLPLGAAPMAYVLFSRFLCHIPADPHWPNRDRFAVTTLLSFAESLTPLLQGLRFKTEALRVGASA